LLLWRAVKSIALPLLLVLPMTLGACLVDDDKGDEENAPSADGKDDSLLRPTYHGAIGFDVPQVAALTAAEGHHAWTFELSGAAEVDVFTGLASSRHRAEVDTVLYLYRQRADGSWGAYIARNDDAGSSRFSSLDRRLDAGRYRATVKGYKTSTRGTFALTVQCAGAGCAPAAAACTLGTTYGEIFEQPHLQVMGRNKITSADLPDLSEEDRARIVLATQQSSHDDVTTAEEAFARVDQGEFNFAWVIEPEAQRRYTTVEYGAGDNSYGAVFGRGTDLIASIHDGDLMSCELAPATCVLSDTYYEMRTDAAFSPAPRRTVNGNTALSQVEADQVLAALRDVYGAQITDLATGFSFPDGGEVNLQRYTHRATSAAFDVVEFGAGDTSVGLIFVAGTTNAAGVINDSAIEHCAFVE
jgi:hypothetical protein